MLLIYLVLIIIILCLLMMHWYQTRSRTALLLNAFPGPPTPPIFGHPIKMSTKSDVLYYQIRKLMATYNETFRLWAAFYPSVHIVRADDAEIILSSMKYIDKGFVYYFLEPWLREGLLLSTARKWQHRRKILTPAFHFNILRKFVTTFAENSDIFIKQLQEECIKPTTDIVPLLAQLTLSNICETAMGTKLTMGEKSHGAYLDALHSMGDILSNRFIQPLYYNNIIYNLSRLGRKASKHLQILHKFTRNVIIDRETNFKDEDVEDLDNTVEDMYKSKKRLAMLDLLISAKKHRNEIDDEGIREEVDTFMFEGHDTTSVAICYTLMTLANHSDIQEKIIMEVDDIFGTSNRQATYDDLQSLKYTEMCIKECLRLYPSVFFIARQVTEDTKLTHHTIPAGTQACIHIYNVHRDPKYYPDPEKFDPERFLPENSKGRHPYAYIPFSAGPRNCIGQKFAMLELKSIVSAVLRNFRMEAIDTAADLQWVTDIVLRTKGSINVKFILRDV